MYVPWHVLIASCDVEERRAMCNILAKLGLDPITAPTIRECEAVVAQEQLGMIFCTRWLADGDYRDLLAAARHWGRKIRIVLAARVTDWDEYLEAMRLGAFDVISAPCRPTDMEWMLIQAMREEHAETRQITLTQQVARSLQGASMSKSA